jgi:hypothetical protein
MFCKKCCCQRRVCCSRFINVAVDVIWCANLVCNNWIVQGIWLLAVIYKWGCCWNAFVFTIIIILRLLTTTEVSSANVFASNNMLFPCVKYFDCRTHNVFCVLSKQC